MQLASVRRFREGVTSYTKGRELVIVTNHGKMVGCFLPLQKTEGLPIELKKEFVSTLGKQIAMSLSTRKTSEEEILNDFKEFKKNCRR